jgi:superfamily II DNA or RNA helicase
MALPFALRPYQTPAVERVKAGGFRRLLIAGPTGTGKSYVVLAIQAEMPGTYVIVPNESIMQGLLSKLGIRVDNINTTTELYGYADALRIFTPVRFKNLLLAGKIEPPSLLVVDEAHHFADEGDTADSLEALCDCPFVGVTATPYRGTPAGTLAFRKRWGEPLWTIRIDEAITDGFWTLPVCETWPLVNDDLIEVRNGQLVVSQIEGATRDKLEHLIDRMVTAGLWNPLRVCSEEGSVGKQPTNEATIITMPGTATAKLMHYELQARGLASSIILQDTSYADRKRAVDNINTHALVQIRTVGEGTDLPIRCMVDAAPTLSPVLWLQRFGRLTRPGGISRYICTNLNYTRHCYLLEGCAPEIYLRDAVRAFEGISERSAVRAFGLQSLGRIKATRVATTGGLEVHFYGIATTAGTQRIEYGVIVHPNKPLPFWFKKVSGKEDGQMVWGEWERCPAPDELQGFRSAKPTPLSDRQREWWQRSAARHGLDPEQEIDARRFSILPILSKSGVRL